MMKKIACVVFTGLAAASASAQTTDIQAKTPYSAYVQDGRGVIARSGTGLCWRTGYWTPADSVPGCDGPLAPPVEKPVAPPVVVAPPPPPPPPPPPAPPKRCDFTVTLANDETFAYNKAALTDAAKKRLDSEVLTKLGSCAKVDIVMVTGHTDKLGTQQYNQKLSEKRAEAVAAYMKGKGADATMDTLGVGKTQSIKACDDKLKRKKLIECLAPNRRVVVEVRGLAK